MRNTLQKIISLLIVFVFLAMGTMGAEAQGSDCEGGVCPEGAESSDGFEGGDTEGLTGFYTKSLRGGYVASGVGLRNMGKGTIRLRGIPRGAKVYKAFLYWNIMDDLQKSRNAQLKFRGYSVRGTYVGGDHETCWLPNTMSSFSYRADVTRYVTGNGNYVVSGVASGLTDGSDPWSAAVKPPLAQGASLVVIYTKSSYPYTKFLIWDGAASTPYDADPYTLTMGNFPAATDPVGPARTTFIVADGQPGGDNATVNYNSIPSFGFDGTDRRDGPMYSGGNLWDTKTTYVGRYMDPGDNTVNIGLSGYGDCLTWVAQVFSISKGNIDTDKDALLDGWEATGYDWDGNGSIDVDLPAMGASPFHKDIFVEHDWMTVDTSHDHKPSTTVLNNVRKSFATAPVSNPDGKRGIKLHNDLSNEIPHATYITSTSDCSDLWIAFDRYKSINFSLARQKIFHYVIWGHDQCSSRAGVSGISRGIPGSDFLVTLGSWSGYGSEDARTGTYMHELGHNIGLTHGGNTNDHENYKPNHLSVMNYSFQVIGVWRSGARRWDFTRMKIYALNEKNLNEYAGLNGSGNLTPYGTRYYCGSTAVDDNTADTNINWNCKNSIQSSVSTDINKSGSKTTLGQVHNQWANLIYDGGLVGPGVSNFSILSEAETLNYLCLEDSDHPTGGYHEHP